MSDHQLEDLKQFIAAMISQSEVRLETRLTKRIDNLEQKVDDGFAGVGEALDEINTRLDKRDAEVDGRLSKLEVQAA
jgi:tetrahydromethanopterin S-methyltransferase subunit G